MFKQLYVRCAAVFGLVMLMSGCAQTSGDIQPPEIAYGQDMCDQCGMLISEPQFAAALVLEDGTALKFDDTGEMLKYSEENPDAQITAWFVHDYNTEAWVNAEAAYFVADSDLATPMGFGIAAFELEADARSFADSQNVMVLSFAQIRENPPARSMDMH